MEQFGFLVTFDSGPGFIIPIKKQILYGWDESSNDAQINKSGYLMWLVL